MDAVVIISTPEALEAFIEKAVAKAIQPLLQSLATQPQPNDMSYLNAEQAAEYLHRKISTIYSLVQNRKIPSYKRGGKLLFIKSELQQWVEKGRKKTNEEVVAATKQRNL